MHPDTTRRQFLSEGTTLAAGLCAATGGTASEEQPALLKEYPRMHAGRGGPVGSSTDRGKLVPGLRSADAPPVPVEAPDLPKLSWRMVDGAKEFHLHAQPVKRELLPQFWSNHWCYNGSLPGPVIEVNEGDRVRIVLHNELPEPNSLHLHGLELPNRVDGVPFVVAEPVMPGKSRAYEMTLHRRAPTSTTLIFPCRKPSVWLAP